jgi:hypothetical protein
VPRAASTCRRPCGAMFRHRPGGMVEGRGQFPRPPSTERRRSWAARRSSARRS